MVVFMQDYVLTSLFFVNYQAIFMMIVVGYTRPFKIVSGVYLELMNEFATLVLNYHLMCFTEFVDDVDTREFIGRSLIYTTIINLGINFMLIASKSLLLFCRKARLRYQKYQKKAKWEAGRVEREKQRRRQRI